MLQFFGISRDRQRESTYVIDIGVFYSEKKWKDKLVKNKGVLRVE